MSTPLLHVIDVDFTRDSFTGRMQIDDYQVIISGSLQLTRMELWEYDPVLSNQADALALFDAERQHEIDQERRRRPEVRP